MMKWVGIGCFIMALIIFATLAPLALAFTIGTGDDSGGSGGGGEETPADCQKLDGTPKNIIDKVVLPIAHKIDFKDVTAESVEASNATHGPTVDGNTSDHQGPPERAWAADIGNGPQPTKEMDQLAEDLAKCFGLTWSGSGVVSGEKDGYRIQMLYRTNEGGNHYDHVHIGVAA